MALPLASTSIATMAVLLFFAGLPIAAVVAGLYAQIGRVAAAGSVAEAFSWFGTSVSIGIAGGTVAGGWLSSTATVGAPQWCSGSGCCCRARS